jgi:hypothetical protein
MEKERLEMESVGMDGEEQALGRRGYGQIRGERLEARIVWMDTE